MKTLIPILIGLLVVGCGEKQSGNTNESNNTPEKSAKKNEEKETPSKGKDNDGTTAKPENPEANRALISASRNGDLEAVQDALDGGANVNAGIGDGRPPLYFAVWADYTEIAKLLIAKGAKVNQKEFTGFFPLYSAAGGNAGKETIELLIANGANINVIRKRGGSRGSETPLDRAIRKERTQIANLLRKHGAKTYKELEAEDK